MDFRALMGLGPRVTKMFPSYEDMEIKEQREPPGMALSLGRRSVNLAPITA
jgi:hypothetical protein